jgi:arylsulfatase A-like enzyme
MKIPTRLLLACAMGLAVISAQAAKPNIILIISDDHAFTDYGFMGHEVVKTPHLDRISSESLLYTRGYVMPVCSPSLACLLTGKLPSRHGITGNDLAKKNRVDRNPLMRKLLENSLLLPKALTEAGYLTFQTGKLWNATYQDMGFTHGMTTKQGRHGGEGLTIGREGMEPIYQFIETAQEQKKPFFIWHAPLMPHDPHTPPKEILAKYTGKGRTPAAEKYYAMVDWFDQTCGELDVHLTKNGLAENTVILYLADNGWDGAYGYQGKRAKLTPYEMGIRTPMFVRWPKTVKPQRDDETLASILDFPTTILKLAGAKAPADLPGLDLLDRQAMTARKSIFVEAYTHDIADLAEPAESRIAQVVVSGWSKLIIPGQAKPDRPFSTAPVSIELFDLKSDPLEKTNLASERPDEVKRLQAIHTAYKAN